MTQTNRQQRRLEARKAQQQQQKRPAAIDAAAAAAPDAGATVRDAIRIHQEAYRTRDRAGLARARAIYERVLAADPTDPDALHFLGILLHQTDEGARAVALIESAVALAPRDADMRSNLGNVLKEQGRLDDALGAYTAALALAPDNANAHNNLGTVLKALARTDEAIASYQRALALAPRHADAHYNLGNALVARERFTEALEHYSRALALNPGHADARRRLGMALFYSGRRAEATEVFRKWVELEPDNAVARHMLASSEGGAAAPARASDAYVRASFDALASSFDEHLTSLGYRGPELVEAALAAHLPARDASLDVLDAGCGTGLCAPFLRPRARRLEGVDLSAGMLARARSRGAYDALHEAELTGFLTAHGAAYDLVVLSDTFTYFGDLAPAVTASHGALRAGGTLVFSVEHDEGVGEQGYRLEPHGRYSHGEPYVRRVLEQAGFEVRALERSTLRKERGEPVPCLVAVARRAGA